MGRVERSGVVACALIAVGVAGCSGDVTRFDDNPFANPYAKNEPRRNDATSSVPTAPAPSRIESQPLPEVQSYQPPPPSPTYRQSEYAPSYRPTEYAPFTGTSGGSPGIASYNPPASSEITGAIGSSDARSRWSWDGGTAVVIRPGETIDGLSRKYGVPVVAILKANGLTSGSVIRPGQQLVIPRRSYGSVVATAGPPNRLATAKPAPHVVVGGAPAMWRAPRIPPTGAVHVVQPHETLGSIAKHYGRTVTEIAAANHIPPYTRVKMGDHIVIPGTPIADAPRQNPPPAIALPRIPSPTAPKKFVINPDTQPKTDANPEEEGPPTASVPGLRWPARGRVISRFHDKMENGQLNEGINLTLPEGTPIHAAEDGQVVYASSELKGYGNLILIRHPNGFVTAYAHASDIEVKRDDQVRRGQVIAHSGQTGDVGSPQLHFEIRKGRTPVDPMQYLPPAG